MKYFAKQGHKYHKPYCRLCYNVYQSQRRQFEHDGERLTMDLFITELFPLLVTAGEAPWAKEYTGQEPEPTPAVEEEDEIDPYPFPNAKNEVEKKIRHNAIMEALRQTSPLPSD